MSARVRAHRSVSLGVVVLAALVTTALGGTVSAVAQRAITDVRDASSIAGAAHRIDTRLADDPAGQDAQVRRLVSATGAASALEVTGGLLSDPTGGSRLAAGPTDAAELVAGRWPEAPGEAALPAGPPGDAPDDATDDAADGAEPQIGDPLVVGDTTLTVVGTWRADGPVWWDGGDETVVVVAGDTLRGHASTPFARWSITAKPGLLDPDRAVELGAHLATLHGSLNASSANQRGLVSSGDLAPALTSVGEQAITTRSVALVPVSLVALIGAVALVQVVRLVVALRGDEEEMLAARGLSARQATALGAGEGLGIGVLGAALGAGATIGALRLAGDGVAAGAIAASAAAVAIVVASAYGAVTAAAARGLAQRGQVRGRGRSVAGASATVGLVAVAGFAGWRLALARSGTSAADSEPSAAEADVLAVLAPAVLVLVGVLLLAVALTPAVRLMAAVVARGSGFALSLTVRNVARRLTAYAVPVVLLGLASGSVVLAATYDATTASLAQRGSALTAGADVRAQTGTSGPVAPRTDLTAAAGGGPGRASLALVTDVAAGSQEAALTAVPHEAARTLLRAGDETGALVEAIGPGESAALAGVALPDGATSLAVRARVRSGDADHDLPWLAGDSAAGNEQGVGLLLWLADDAGAVVQRPAGQAGPVVGQDVAEAEWVAFAADVTLPAPVGAWRIVALDVEASSVWVPTRVELEVTGLSSGAQPLPDARWRAATDLPSGVGDVVADGGPAVEVTVEPVYSSSATQVVRLRPGAAPGPVPVVMSATLRDRLALDVGDQTQVTIGGGRLDVVVTAVADFLPVSVGEPGILADLDAVRALELERRPAPQVADELWLGSDAGPATLAGLGLGEVVVREATSNGVAGAFWAAAAAAALLALVGTWSVVAALDRTRRGEVVALRAVGVGAREQGTSRAGELLLAAVVAVVAGTAAGTVVGWAAAGYLASLSIGLPAAVGGSMRVDPVVVVGAIAILLLAVGLLAALRGRAVRAQARDTAYREDAR